VARAIVPEAIDGFKVNLPAELVKYTGEASDPAMKAIREHALSEKWSQGQFDDVMGLIKVFSEKGVLAPMFDAAAETAQLGDNGRARQQEALSFATQLKDRGEVTDAEFGELAAFSATAAGVTAMEKLRKMMGPNGQIVAPTRDDAAGAADSPAMAEANKLRADPKYGVDNRFTREADAAWVKAFNADKAARAGG
jgi:hypothetical protein